MPDGPEANESVLHYFVDEAGDPVLFSAKREVNVGTEGCSKYFILGKLDVDDPDGLSQRLEDLRAVLLADPYFKGVPSMRPEKKRTAVAFHAKDDPAEVRREVFTLLSRERVRFYAVVRDKRELVSEVRRRNELDSAYRYRDSELYDALVSKLFRKFHGTADRVNVCFAKRGAKPRTQALRAALEEADRIFQRNFGFANSSETHVSSSTPAHSAGLQAVDYFLWALQRFYERRETRYVDLIWPLVGEVHDLDHTLGGRGGVYYGKGRPLVLDARDP
ncbi:MAG: DUF3800 domain-containing protein [Planctomycetota bacterium]